MIGKLCIAMACTALALSGTAALAQQPNPGPVRDGPVAGDQAAASLSDREISNLRSFTRVYTVARWFHPSDAALAADWDALAIEAIPDVIAAADNEALARAIRQHLAPAVDGLELSTTQLPALDSAAMQSGPRVSWMHNGFQGASRAGYWKRRMEQTSLGPFEYFEEQIGSGLWVRFPLNAAKSEGEDPEPQTQSTYAGKPEGWVPAGYDRTTRIAVTIIAWGALDQFYPYWDVVDADWDALFADQVKRAALAEDDMDFLEALRVMAHELRDGHARVSYVSNGRAGLPIVFDRFGDDIVVAWAADTAGLAPGTVVKSIDGEPVMDRYNHVMGTRSGSAHWRELLALDSLIYGPADEPAQMVVSQPDGTEREVAVDRIILTRENYPRMPRPEPLADMGDGILYVDVARMSDAQLLAAADRLIAADGLIFDLRGRPTGTTFWLGHLTDIPIRSAQFNSPIYEFPDQVNVQYKDASWRIRPLQPRLTQNVVVLSDANAASYPESIVGTFKANGLATIVGSATAGANGDVAAIDLPGGYRIFWTGLQVLSPDGGVHHNIGVLPDVVVEPTLQGIKQGRDEVLEAGLKIVRAELPQP